MAVGPGMWENQHLQVPARMDEAPPMADVSLQARKERTVSLKDLRVEKCPRLYGSAERELLTCTCR